MATPDGSGTKILRVPLRSSLILPPASPLGLGLPKTSTLHYSPYVPQGWCPEVA